MKGARLAGLRCGVLGQLVARARPDVAGDEADGAMTVSVAEAAAMLGVHRTTVHRMVKGGDIRSAGYGRVYRADVGAHIGLTDRRMPPPTRLPPARST